MEVGDTLYIRMSGEDYRAFTVTQKTQRSNYCIQYLYQCVVCMGEIGTVIEDESYLRETLCGYFGEINEIPDIDFRRLVRHHSSECLVQLSSTVTMRSMSEEVSPEPIPIRGSAPNRYYSIPRARGTYAPSTVQSRFDAVSEDIHKSNIKRIKRIKQKKMIKENIRYIRDG